MAPRKDIPFDEWRAEQLRKAPARGGIQSPISPGAGMMGPPGNTSSFAPAGPASRRSGMLGSPAPNQTYGPNLETKYTGERPDQPDPWVDDVDMGANWYSPFQPVWPFGPPNITRPREWDYPVGYNLNYIQPRMELMGMLRALRGSWGVLATIIATRQDQLLRIPWTIQRRDKPRQTNKTVDEMRRFFRRPDGKLSYSQWTRLITDDLLVLDAPTIYFSRDRTGRPLTAERLDPITVFPLIDDAGRRPDSVVEIDENGLTYLRRQPAFQQIIKGLPMIDLDESELMYVPMRPRADLPMFGYPATEQILVEASAMIRKTLYQYNFWGEGTIPDMIVTVPDTWSPRQIAMFQAHFDALLSGNLVLKSKVRFLPGGMKPFDIKNSSGENLYGTWDETMIRLACYAYSVSPAPFIKMLNRSTAQNAQQMAEAEGLYPLMSFWKDDILDPIIQERFGYEDVEFVFLPRPEPDSEKQAKIHQIQVKEGIRPRNEVREELGLEPIPGGDVTLVELGNIIVPLEDAARGEAAQAGSLVSPSSELGSQVRSRGAAQVQGQPQRGQARPISASPLPKSTSVVGKASKFEVRAAAREATGGIDNYSHLVLSNGNYKKGHVWIQGLDISIENRKGSKRGEKDQHGKKWEVKMPTAYGYIRGTIGADGMQVDVYLGKHPNSPIVWVIDQDKVTPEGQNNGFDEHKVMLGYKNLRRALKDYLKSHFDGHGHERVHDVVELPIDEFKAWLSEGDMKLPIEDQIGGDAKVVLTQKDLQKSDTISSSTNLLSYSQMGRRKGRKKRREASGPRWLSLIASTVTIALLSNTPTFAQQSVTGTPAYLNVPQSWVAAQRGRPLPVSISASTFSPNFNTSNNFSITLVHASCPCTVANPITVPVAGQSGIFAIIQSSSGSDTIGTWGSSYKFGDGTSTIILSTAPNTVDYIPYYVKDSAHIILGPLMNAQAVTPNAIDAVRASGADMCAKISNAAGVLNGINPYGGTIDARGFAGVQHCSGSMFASWPGGGFWSTVLLGGVNIQTDVQQGIPSRTALYGSSPYSDEPSSGQVGGASIQASDSFPTNTAVLFMGTASPDSYAVRVSNLMVSCRTPGSTNPVGSIGVQNLNSQENTELSHVGIRGCYTGLQIAANAADGESYKFLTMGDTGLNSSDFVCIQVGSVAGGGQQIMGDIEYVSCGANSSAPNNMILLDSFNYSLKHIYLECQSGAGCVNGVNIGSQGIGVGTRNILIEDLYCGGGIAVAPGGNCVNIASGTNGPVTLTSIAGGGASSNLLNDTLTGGCVIPRSQESALGFYARGVASRIISNSSYCPKP